MHSDDDWGDPSGDEYTATPDIQERVQELVETLQAVYRDLERLDEHLGEFLPADARVRFMVSEIQEAIADVEVV